MSGQMAARPAHVIVLGNEKGGSGKSTTAMHLCVALMRGGHRVGAIDLDLRQQSFFRYLEHREAHGTRIGKRLLVPERFPIVKSKASLVAEADREDHESLLAAIAELSTRCAFILIDTPGAVTQFNRSAHQLANTLITPINDSLIDFDLLGRVDPESGKVLGPSVYAELVWEARQRRAASGLEPLDWVVLRNRMSTLESRNRRQVSKVMAELADRIGFRIVPGFSERVIFRELFLNGLTLLDLKQGGQITMTLSHVAARQEVRDMVRALTLPEVGPVQ
ncbi:MAG: division plane positioning ATPase MipZ [Pseudomonadota bacterium]